MADASTALIGSAPDAYREHVATLVAQLDFMRAKIEESQERIERMPIVIAYDNGGGQSGIRKNPAYAAYIDLMRAYTRTLAELREWVGDGEQAKPALVDFEKFAKSMRKREA